ncbi:MAG TPA: extracellular solute-binding protein, partial [Thermomicrobiales bacterium]|nr:extracellular solute-binding protein [Thermomicrobiales bacterium]
MTTLRVALIGGPTYDPLYDRLPDFTARTGIDVEVVAQLPHHDLNAFVATHHAELDLISTHIKYAPSQVDHLLPLDDLLNEGDLAPFLPGPLAQSRINGTLFQLPRRTDTRLLVYRTDLVARPPATWFDLPDLAADAAKPPGQFGFAFCTQPSGLFGAFYELLASAGGSLFTDDLRPNLRTNKARWAVQFLKSLHAVSPPESIAW